MVNSVLQSKAPLQQNLYGDYGRVSGLLTYLFLAFLVVGTLTFRKESEFLSLIKALLIAGQANIFYCLWVLAFGDPIGWDNKYGSLLGLLGNPDFISAFLGMFIALVMSVLRNANLNRYYRIYLLFLVPIAFFEILKTHAIQGLVVTAGGCVLVSFFYVRSRLNSIVQLFSILIMAILGLLAVLGTLQKGPLDFLYKRSVSLRGTYWRAGYEMGIQNFWHGVGMDTYGDWYRKVRPPIALIDTPGIDVSSNVSHNVVLDFFAFGGFPLVATYLALLVYALSLCVSHICKNKKYDSIFVGLFVVWASYQVQSLISINQIGLSIWGWVFTGALISFIKSRNYQEPKKEISGIRGRTATKTHLLPAGLIGVLCFMLGLFISAPPIAGDSSWMRAINSNNLNQVTNALTPSYFSPPSSFKYSQAVQLFSNSNLPDESIKYARLAVEFNPDYFYAWRDLYFLPNSTASEKNQSKANMKRLDPLNPKIDELK
jgi:O-antigen ligase